MERFHVIDDAAVILRSKGVYRQVKVFRRGDGLYAAYGGGFVRLYKDNATGLPLVSWDDIDLGDRAVAWDALGKLSLGKPVAQIEGGK